MLTAFASLLAVLGLLTLGLSRFAGVDFGVGVGVGLPPPCVAGADTTPTLSEGAKQSIAKVTIIAVKPAIIFLKWW